MNRSKLKRRSGKQKRGLWIFKAKAFLHLPYNFIYRSGVADGEGEKE